MRRGLRPFFPICLTNERCTSKVDGPTGCFGELRKGKGRITGEAKTSKRRRSLRERLHCAKCRKTWDRDLVAALNILAIARYQSEHKCLLPNGMKTMAESKGKSQSQEG